MTTHSMGQVGLWWDLSSGFDPIDFHIRVMNRDKTMRELSESEINLSVHVSIEYKG